MHFFSLSVIIVYLEHANFVALIHSARHNVYRLILPCCFKVEVSVAALVVQEILVLCAINGDVFIFFVSSIIVKKNPKKNINPQNKYFTKNFDKKFSKTQFNALKTREFWRKKYFVRKNA